MDKEIINLEKSCELETSQLAGEVPTEKPRYHFFLFKHTHEGDYLESIGKFWDCPKLPLIPGGAIVGSFSFKNFDIFKSMIFKTNNSLRTIHN